MLTIHQIFQKRTEKKPKRLVFSFGNEELTLEADRRIGESKSSAGLRPGGIANQEEGEAAEGGDMGSDGGGRDLNLGTPDPVLSAIRSPSPLLTAAAEVVVWWLSEVRRLVKEVEDMNGLAANEKDDEEVDCGCEFAMVSKVPEEAIITYKHTERVCL